MSSHVVIEPASTPEGGAGLSQFALERIALMRSERCRGERQDDAALTSRRKLFIPDIESFEARTDRRLMEIRRHNAVDALEFAVLILFLTAVLAAFVLFGDDVGMARAFAEFH
ncbi:hypothetical protein SAMN04488498_110196 [Mesorhizobium albiziae]|uniref:Uncharacterized protein n=1 Tax=Neomesorhizobium albiziae TaxID=335020 RepID=A0A1I4BLW4_9HYPH|nr:hypothetical protein GCM10007937_16360 [Mesorhizobium albiziae]SFK68956.1 hypothetical protein SAMN04488498_110196 [Mesorhizobium albiziae]